MSKLDTCRILLLKAAHKDTPIEEARNSALQAARLIAQYEFLITDPTATTEAETAEVRFPDDYFPDDQTQFEEVELFHTRIATITLVCAKCNRAIVRGSTFAETASAHVHYSSCISYFTEKK